MKLLVSFFIGLIIFSLLGWLGMFLPTLPYNIRELFNVDNPLLTLFVFSLIFYWCFGIPVYMALWLIKGKWWRVIIFPFLIVLHGGVAYGLLRISVPIESIYDIVGSPILSWPWEWELLGRFIALFGVFSLFLSGGAFVAFLQSYDYFSKWQLIWRWIANVVILLPIGYWVIVIQASTDNLTELMRGGGNCISVFLLCSWIFIIACSTSTFLVQICRYRYYNLSSAIIFGILSLPLGYLAFQFGTENVIYKYERTFSAMQFLFSPNRTELLGGEALMLRYIIFHIIIVGIIAIAQYPFWNLIGNDKKFKSRVIMKINKKE